MINRKKPRPYIAYILLGLNYQFQGFYYYSSFVYHDSEALRGSPTNICVTFEGRLLVLFNGFQKKTQKTPKTEIDKAMRLKDEYFKQKRQTK